MMKVFRLSDCEWWMAESLDKAIELASKESGLPPDEVTDNPAELTDEQLDTCKFFYDPYSKDEYCSFRERLEYLTRDGRQPKPGLFATTEW